MYMGGNGFYWVTPMDASGRFIEVRRRDGTEHWQGAPGEHHHSLTGEPGGLWRFRGMAPQQFFGVGFTAQGFDRNSPYRRMPGSFDPRAAARGKRMFYREGGCGSCHSGPTYTDVRRSRHFLRPFLHEPTEVGMDPTYANRSATGKYRTTPLRALWQHAPYFHDGSAPDLPAVVEHYDDHFELNLTDAQKFDLVEFLKTL